jgi:5'-3' exonuclease
MEFNLTIDGNYILSKNVFILHKNNVLFGDLYKSLMTSFNKYVGLGFFKKIYFVSDSNTKSWRKDFYLEYKATRKKNTDIDWNFVNECYQKFKEDLILSERAIVLESPKIEGDDWIHIITKKCNASNIGNVIISGDSDLKQLLTLSVKNKYVNVQLDDYVGRERLFIPVSLTSFLNDIDNDTSVLFPDDVFDLKEEFNLNTLLNRFPNVEIDNKKELFFKLIVGDTQSDNIPSIYYTQSDKRPIGIGEKTCEKIYDEYILTDLINENNIIPINEDYILFLVKKARKLIDDTNDEGIKLALERNIKLIHLHYKHLPNHIRTEIVKKLQ